MNRATRTDVRTRPESWFVATVDLVRLHDELSLTGAVVPVADPGAVVGELVARIAGFGPLQLFLDEPYGRGDLDQLTGPGVRG